MRHESLARTKEKTKQQRAGDSRQYENLNAQKSSLKIFCAKKWIAVQSVSNKTPDFIVNSQGIDWHIEIFNNFVLFAILAGLHYNELLYRKRDSFWYVVQRFVIFHSKHLLA